MRKIKIFLASSNELKSDREQFEIEIYRKTKLWFDKGIFLHLEIWEDLSSKVSLTRSQDEYNSIIKSCDIFILLVHTKFGIYSAEEFEIAFGSYHAQQKPFIFTYFKLSDQDRLPSVMEFEQKLNALGYFYNQYPNFDHLWNSFNTELDRLLLNDFDTYVPNVHSAPTANQPHSKQINIGDVHTQGGDFRIGDNY